MRIARTGMQSFLLCAVLMFQPCPLWSVAQAASPSVGIDDLYKMIKNLGYSSTKAGDSVQIKIQSKNEYIVGVSLNEDHSQVFGFIKLFEVPDDKVAKMPSLDMLTFNDDGSDYFSVHKTGGLWHTMLNFQRSATSIQPQVLRGAIDRIVKDADATLNLSNPDNWK